MFLAFRFKVLQNQETCSVSFVSQYRMTVARSRMDQTFIHGQTGWISMFQQRNSRVYGPGHANSLCLEVCTVRTPVGMLIHSVLSGLQSVSLVACDLVFVCCKQLRLRLACSYMQSDLCFCFLLAA